MQLMLIIAILIIPLIAQLNISSAYKKYSKKKIKTNKTGFEVARKMLDDNGLESVYIVETKGKLTDHYDPRRKVVKLSTDIYHGNTIAATAVAAHEVGHAIQDKDKYFYLKLRSLIFPIVNVATSLSYFIILGSFLFASLGLLYVGIAFTSLGLLFQVITLPVEFNASKRALNYLQLSNELDNEDMHGSKKMLTAAALTYLAGVLASALEIVRLLLIARD